ncbi:hypothetical protein [Sphingomonas daechungensis]|uniref:hypothetical protein n=1 Tax=Sphingomonas daechungensis TaxID=1176646 RepID=UPI003784B5BC
MRKILPLTGALLLSACATQPGPEPEPASRPTPTGPSVPGSLVNMTAAELIQKMGQPKLQVREGPGLKLQFKSRSCILDAYLYPSPSGGLPERVTHVDTRLSNGNDTSQQACIASLIRS